MSKQANPTLIGGFVLGALALVIVGILVFSSGAWLRERVRLVTYFPGTVQGLSVGAQVQFQGVPIGQVTGIGLDYLPERDSFRIPVHYEIWPQSVRVIGAVGDADVRDVVIGLIEQRGLRARLESVSIVTGQYLISLSTNPGLPRRQYETDPDGPIRVPALAATRDRIEDMMQNLRLDELVETANATLTAIRNVAESGAIPDALSALNTTLARAERLIGSIEAQVGPISRRADAAIAAYTELAQSLREQSDRVGTSLTRAGDDLAALTRGLDARLDPLSAEAERALTAATGAMRAIEGMTGERSTTRIQLDRLLAESIGAARSVRVLADYLERHPEALLQGKR